MSPALPRDTECTNVPAGPQVLSFFSTDVPLAMEQAFKAVMPGKPGPVAAKPAAKAAAGAAKAPTTAASGFVRSATKPDHNAVNWQATNAIPGKKAGDGKFIMRDGSRVLYSR